MGDPSSEECVELADSPSGGVVVGCLGFPQGWGIGEADAMIFRCFVERFVSLVLEAVEKAAGGPGGRVLEIAEGAGFGEDVEDNFGHAKIVERGDFEVHGGTGDDVDRFSEAFDDLGFVGGVEVSPGGVGVSEQGRSEDLRRLGLPEVVAGDGFDNASIGDPLDGAGGGNRGDGGVEFDRGGEDFVDPGIDEEGPRGVVDRDEIDIVADVGEAVLDAVGAFGAAGDDFDVAEGEVVAEGFLEPGDVLGRDADDGLGDVLALGEEVGAAEPDSSAAKFRERLLALFVGEPAALSGGG